MKGLERIAQLTQKIDQKDRTTWVMLYYSIEDHEVFDKPGDNRLFVAELINKHTPEEVKEAVEDWLKM